MTETVFKKLLSILKRNKMRCQDNNRQDHPVMVDSAFSSSSCYNNSSSWDDDLEEIHQHGEQLVISWYQSLEQLALMLDKVTSPFQTTNRSSLHQTQQFIESYLNNWKFQRYTMDTFDQKLQMVDDQFSDHTELKKCVLYLYELEKKLYIYQQTMDTQLTLLWNTRQKDQDMDVWKKYLQHSQFSTNQMENKLKTLLENSTPNPDEYTCAVCLSIFTDPVTIPCLHTFCKNCLQHIYCTCRRSYCTSPCHDATKRPTNIDDDSDKSRFDSRRKYSRGLSSYKPRYRSMISPKATKNASRRRQSVNAEENNTTFSSTNYQDPVLFQCDCPLSWSVPPAAQCPLCRYPFAPEDITLATALDNFIRFYFPRQDRVRQRYHARQRQLKRRSFLNTLSQKLVPSTLPSVPLPPRRLPPHQSHHNHYSNHHVDANYQQLQQLLNQDSPTSFRLSTHLLNLAHRTILV
ncbi:uncharacterized protein BX664DRAFT_326692 [Halteromyces radiatus]|uniref:uncharacterized protein n=1 Tax=Halteromyces radiatus TaxID=101107 RepID=UPI00221F31CC|nr:uncharacterized protein BX664DRAFT_326692 [Halteromyces radiatus]KAI8097562.1 hypothetical protein BX664DRAFT_326692 [Halteromyces radiatus]